jgi:hypothetical protein
MAATAGHRLTLDPMGKCSNAFFSETTNMIKDKLYMNVHWMVLYNLKGNFSQSEHIIGPGSHVEYPTGTKNRNFVEDHPRNIPAKFGSNWPSGFGEEAGNVKSL